MYLEDFRLNEKEMSFMKKTFQFPCGTNFTFDEEKYHLDVDAHHETLGSCESGHASEQVAKRIYDVMTKG